jgi:hypothetical protein
LLAALLLLSAVFRPYAGLVHDARLYAVQVLEHVTPGLHGDGLYLRYGSQDAYSVFSWLAAPLVQAIGLPATFFVLYLGSTGSFLFGLQRLVAALVRPRGMAVLALVYLAVNPIPFGGLSVFHVHESFLTPRLLANGLVLLGLERLVRKHTWASLGLLAAAVLVHPIMACGGLLVWVAWNALAHLRPRTILVLAGAIGLTLTLVLVCTPLGIALFGHMDEAWRSAVYAANFYAFPAQWPPSDWLRIGVAFAVLAGAGRLAVSSARARRLLDAVIVVAAAGTVVGLLAPYLPYRLLVQGQPYRALWLTQLLQVPLVFALVGQWNSHRTPTARAATVLLIAAFAWATMTSWQVLSAILLLGVGYLWRRTTRGPAPAPVWLKLAAVATVTAIAAPSIASAIHAWRELLAVLPPVLCIQTVPLTIGPFLLIVQGACFAIPESPLYRWMDVQRTRDIEFVADYLRERHETAERDGDAELPTVFWSAANLEDIWFELPAKSFFVTQQVSGNMFNRGTAIEGQRRARLVAAFDLDSWRASRYSIADWKRRSLERVYGRDLDSSPPTLEDLHRLCREDALDVAVLRQEFDGWVSRSNGRWFIYDCRQIREAMAAKLRHSADPTSPIADDANSSGSATHGDHASSEDSRRILSPPDPRASPSQR